VRINSARAFSPFVISRRDLMEANDLYYKYRQAVGNLIYEATSGNSVKDSLELNSLVSITNEILEHGFKNDKTFFRAGKSPWNFIELRTKNPEALATVLALTESVPDARLETWIKMGLLQQNLSIQFKDLFCEDDTVAEWYEPTAFLRNIELRAGMIGSALLTQKL
jgi:hypothetical protein